MTSDGKILFCRFCERKINADEKSLVLQHLATQKHRDHAALKVDSSDEEPEGKISRQQLLSECKPKPNLNSQFCQDLTEVLISSNIPLFKVSNPASKEFLEKWTEMKLPDESTLRKTYLPKAYSAAIKEIRERNG